MACELAGHFYLGLGETAESMKHFLRAHERYKEWVSIDRLGIYLESLLVLLKYFDFVANFNRHSLSTTSLSKGALGKCDCLFKFLEAIYDDINVNNGAAFSLQQTSTEET